MHYSAPNIKFTPTEIPRTQTIVTLSLFKSTREPSNKQWQLIVTSGTSDKVGTKQ